MRTILITKYVPRKREIIHQSGNSQPLVFAKETFEELRKLHGDKAVWKLIEAYPEGVLKVNIDAELPPDADTPSDYNRFSPIRAHNYTGRANSE